MTTYEDIAVLAHNVQETEHKFLLHGPRYDPLVTPWMPYQPADFIGILWECMPEIENNYFLDVGCGPGTKMDIAYTLFRLEVFGVEVNEEMAEVARKRFKGLRPNRISTCDALTLNGPNYYANFDIIWLYRPFREAVSEYKLEKLIIDRMKPGAILAGSSWEIDPGTLGWQPIVDDCLISPDGSNKIVRGAWQKPGE